MISAIKPLKDDAVRCGIYVGRRRVAVLMLDQIEHLGLYVGAPWDPERQQRTADAALHAKARRDALKLVNRRALGSPQMTEKLIRKGHAPQVARAVTQELLDKKFLDDEAYGRTLLDTQLRKPTGRRMLQQKLQQKKLPTALVKQLVNQADAGRDAVADARRLAEQKLRGASFRKLDDAGRKRRIWGLLARRGFEPQTIINAIANLPGMRGGEVSDDF